MITAIETALNARSIRWQPHHLPLAIVADKDLERYHLQQLFRALGLPGVEDARAGEAPDFVLMVSGRRVGVELTAFHMPATAGQRGAKEIDGLRDLSVDCARRRFRERGGPALYVHIDFDHDGHINKRAALQRGEELAALLLESPLPRSITEGAWAPPDHLLPPTVVRCRVLASVDGSDELWDGGGGGWVAPIHPPLVQAVLDAKDSGISRYRTRCDSVWLVIVNDPFRGGQPVELSEGALAHAYSYRFDRALWLEAVAPHAHDLRRSTALL